MSRSVPQHMKISNRLTSPNGSDRRPRPATPIARGPTTASGQCGNPAGNECEELTTKSTNDTKSKSPAFLFYFSWVSCLSWLSLLFEFQRVKQVSQISYNSVVL